MSKKEEFDCSIKNKFINGEVVLPDIKIENDSKDFKRIVRGHENDMYFSVSFGNELKNKLDSKIQEVCKRELKEHFFSVASSSRFAVASFTRNINGVIGYINKFKGKSICNIEFEHGLVIHQKNGRTASPQMDVWIKTDIENFIEVKCHEIFDSHNQIRISINYDNDQNLAFKEIDAHYRLDKSKIVKYKKKGREYEYFLFDKQMFGINTKTSHFDLKQLICHLLGIIGATTGKQTQKNLIYLFYKNEDTKFVKIYEELEEEINAIKESFGWLFKEYHINFEVLYNDKFDTIKWKK